MSFLTFISTTADLDLSQLGAEGAQFLREERGLPELRYLEFPHVWFLVDADGLSNGFRNVELPNVPLLGFAPPESWSPEDRTNIAATQRAFGILAKLVHEGAHVDSFTFWDQGPRESRNLEGVVEVSLAKFDATRLRFFDGYRFVYTE
jgi:hypothetical protein